jgi:hypothetical protein
MKLAIWALAALGATVVPALAADSRVPPGGIALSEDGSQVTVRPASNIRTKSVAAPATALSRIVDNLAEKYPDGRYDPYGGYNVVGPNASGFTSRNWTGVAFTPAADANVARIEVAVKLIAGSNRVVLSLRDDNAGLPGAVLQSWAFSNLPPPVTCCTVKVGTSDAGIPVQGGHQYWVVLSTDANSKDTFAEWNSNVTEPLAQVLIAREQGTGWNGFTQAPAPAFAVFASP